MPSAMPAPRVRARTAVVALVAALCLLPAAAADAAPAAGSVTEAQGRLVEYERLGLAADVDAQLDYVAEHDAAAGAAWREVVEGWNSRLFDYQLHGSSDPASASGVPDGLPNTPGHVFVVLGNVLNSDGSAKPELTDRLLVTKAALTKYPSTRVLVTGGHTAGADKASEGEVMRDWLLANGISADRIFTETAAGDTPDNATMSMPILYGLKADADGRTVGATPVTSISVITSGWHARRGNVLYATETALLRQHLGLASGIALLDGPSCVSASCQNSSYVTPPGYPGGSERDLIAQNVAKVASDLARDADGGAVTGVTTAYNAFRASTNALRSSVAKVVYLQQSGFAGDDANPRNNAADLVRAIAEAGDVSDTYATELPAFVAAWDAALHPFTISSTVPTDLPTSKHAFVLMGADSGTGTANANRIAIARAALAQYPGSIVVVAGNAAELTAGYTGLTTGSDAVATSRIKVAEASTNAPQGTVNAMRVLYNLGGAVTSYTPIVSGNYVRRPTVLFAAAELQQRQAHRASFRITPTAAIAETSTGTPDANLPDSSARSTIVNNVNEILLGSSSPSEYTAWTSSPPALSTLQSIAVTPPTRTSYLQGESFDPAGMTVSATLDNGTSRIVDITGQASVTASTAAVGARSGEVSYVYRGVTRTASFSYTVRAADVAALEGAVAQAAALDADDYDAASYAAVVAARDTALGVVADPAATEAQVSAALQGLQAALGALQPARPTVTVTLSSAGAGGWYSVGTTATVTATPSSAHRPVVTVEYAVGDQAWKTYTGRVALPVGSYVFRARATDGQGSVSAVASVPVKVGPNGTPVLAATATKVAYGAAARVAVTVRLAGTAVAGGTVTVGEGSTVLGEAKVSGGRATVTLPRTLAVGEHRVRVTYTPVAGSGIKAVTKAGAATVSVSKARAKISAKRTKGTLVRGRKATVRVVVKGAAGVKVTGKVVLTVGGKRVGTAKVKKSGSRYVATVRTRTLVRKGKVKVVYQGSARYAKVSKKTSLTVR